MLKFIVLSILVATVLGDSSEEHGARRVHHHGHRGHHARSQYGAAPKYGKSYEAPKYDFAWQAQAVGGGSGEYGRSYGGSASDFGHVESRDGDRTQGKHWVQLPDGRTQIVEYVVEGDSGFNAKVSHTGGDYKQSRY